MLNFIFLQITGSTGTATADTAKKIAAAIPPVTTPAVTEIKMSVIDLIMKGGWIMIPLVVFLALAIFFAIERLVVIAKAAGHNRMLIPNLRDYILNGQMDSARNLCRSMNSPVSRVIEKGISRIGRPSREIEDAMEKVGRQEIGRLEKNLSILSLLARLAPMFGFVGTIMGVITIFFQIALQDNISISVISSGLYQKMITSAGGLIVGLIAFACYHLLNSWVDRIAMRIEKTSMEFIDLMHEPAK
ncbi:MAG: biopolymer transport protein ExbB [Bacteroidetes bacterium]|nr:MAG: biopolymer transport protein ExbB [Bacteroidota bacterium]